MLQVRDVSKSYGERQVLRDITFDVAPGRLTGFVGGNGAGKTTTIRIILGLLSKDGGNVLMDRVELDAARRRTFGYMPEERGLYPKMKVLEQIVYIDRLHGTPKTEATERASALLTELGLAERLEDNIDTLSLGNQQRAQIAAAIVHRPDVMILDEPFSGLDPMAVDTVVDVLQRRAARGASILFSSHQLDVVERICDDLVILADGTVRAAGSRDGLREEHSGSQYALSMDGDVGWLRQEAGVDVIDFAGGDATFTVDSPAVAQQVIEHAVARGAVTKFGPLNPTLAQIFREVVQ